VEQLGSEILFFENLKEDTLLGQSPSLLVFNHGQ
jgi:hypothetical protein